MEQLNSGTVESLSGESLSGESLDCKTIEQLNAADQ